MDHHLRVEGEYRCEVKTTISKGRDKKDRRSQSRCMRDSVRISGAFFRLERVFYEEDACQSNPLGVVSREGIIEDIGTEGSGDQTRFFAQAKGEGILVRTNPDWVSESEGRCPIKGFGIGKNTPISLQGPCSSILPQVPKKWRVSRANSDSHSAGEHLSALDDKGTALLDCTRY